MPITFWMVIINLGERSLFGAMAHTWRGEWAAGGVAVAVGVREAPGLPRRRSLQPATPANNSNRHPADKQCVCLCLLTATTPLYFISSAKITAHSLTASQRRRYASATFPELRAWFTHDKLDFYLDETLFRFEQLSLFRNINYSGIEPLFLIIFLAVNDWKICHETPLCYYYMFNRVVFMYVNYS